MQPISAHKFGIILSILLSFSLLALLYLYLSTFRNEYFHARRIFVRARRGRLARVLIKRTALINHVDGYLHSLFPYIRDRNIPFKRYAEAKFITAINPMYVCERPSKRAE